MSGAVQDILKQIQQLPEPDQRELRWVLAQQEEQEWARLSAAARDQARARGIDDGAIARAVESHRYGDEPIE